MSNYRKYNHSSKLSYCEQLKQISDFCTHYNIQSYKEILMFKSKCSQCKFNTITLDVTDQEKYGHDCHVESDYIEFANIMNKCLNCKYGYRLFSIPWFRTKSQFESRNENE